MQISQLGPYELGPVIGKGGMGAVYEAVDAQSGQRVAVKALSPQLAQAEGFRERFDAEIESLKTLHHDGIVRLYGYGEQDSILFYSMELVDGTSLEEELKRGRRFDWREVASIAIQVCRALKHAHDHGVVHRDIKPANILIDANNHVKLADFGIARLFGSTQLTSAGGVLGTADYMSPEQADGRPVTDRCDQYSLGGVMYALLAGRTPFRARTLPEMIQLQRFAQPEPVRRYARDTPEQLEYVIMQLLSKDPQARFPNTLVLARHMEAMVRALTRPAADDFSIDYQPSDQAKPFSIANYDESLSITRAEVESSPDDFEGTPPLGVRATEPVTPGGVDERIPAVGSSGDDVTTPPAPATLVTARASDSRSTERTSFTSVEDELQRRRAAERRAWRAAAVQASGVIVLLGALVGLFFYLAMPEDADALYGQIRAAADDESSLRNVDSEIDDFLKRFPGDPRAGEVSELRQQLELTQLERKLQLRSRQGGRLGESLLPSERLYINAVRLVDQDLEGAVGALEAMLVLYDPALSPNASLNAEHSGEHAGEVLADRQAACVELARRKLEELRVLLADRVAEQLPQIRQRLDAANALVDQDPGQAHQIYRAIIDLFGNCDWAEREVAEAEQRIQELP